jgi:NTE family protein
MSPLSRVRYLALEGGAGKGRAYAPVIRRLEEVGAKLEAVSGTSAGALTAGVLAMGADAAYVEHLARSRDFEAFLSRWCLLDPGTYVTTRACRVVRTKGTHPAHAPMEWIRSQLEHFGHRQEITFAELLLATGIELHVAAVSWTWGRLQIFSATETPDVPVALAMLASMSIPGIWPPVVIDGDVFVDGGALCNHPVCVFDGREPAEILGVRVDSREEIDGGPVDLEPGLGGLWRYIGRVLGIVLDGASRQWVPEHLWERIIRIDVTGIPGLDFGPAHLEALLQAGRRAVEEFETRNYTSVVSPPPHLSKHQEQSVSLGGGGQP